MIKVIAHVFKNETIINKLIFLIDSNKNDFISSLQKRYLTGRLDDSYTIFNNNYVFVIDIYDKVPISAEDFFNCIGGYNSDTQENV